MPAPGRGAATRVHQRSRRGARGPCTARTVGVTMALEPEGGGGSRSSGDRGRAGRRGRCRRCGRVRRQPDPPGERRRPLDTTGTPPESRFSEARACPTRACRNIPNSPATCDRGGRVLEQHGGRRSSSRCVRLRVTCRGDRTDRPRGPPMHAARSRSVPTPSRPRRSATGCRSPDRRTAGSGSGPGRCRGWAATRRAVDRRRCDPHRSRVGVALGQAGCHHVGVPCGGGGHDLAAAGSASPGCPAISAPQRAQVPSR